MEAIVVKENVMWKRMLCNRMLCGSECCAEANVV